MKAGRILFALVMAIGVFSLPYCGGDDGGGTVTGQCWTGACPSGWKVSGQDCVFDGAVGTLSGTLVDFQTRQPINGALVQVLDNSTGEAIPVCTTSANGTVTLSGIPATMAKVGLRNTMLGNKDTYQFNMALNASGEVLWLVSETTYTLAPMAAGLTVDPTKGAVAGGVYFVNATSQEEPVGCAAVSTDQGGDIRYFGDDGMPTTIANQAKVNVNNGYFLAVNIAPGVTEVTAEVGATEVGSTSIVTFANSICISNVYVTTGTNPTPATCP